MLQFTFTFWQHLGDANEALRNVLSVGIMPNLSVVRATKSLHFMPVVCIVYHLVCESVCDSAYVLISLSID